MIDPSQRKALVSDKKLAISCIIPIYNEEEGILTFIQSLHEHISQLTEHFEIIIVDDGSNDSSIETLQPHIHDFNLKLLSFSRNFGKEAALSAGLNHCSGQVAILIDADFQHPLDIINTFVQQWEQGYDMVYGVRRSRDNESKIKRFFAHIFYKIIDVITPIKIPPNAGDFRLLDRKVINALNKLNERERFMKGLYAWVGFKSIPIPFDVAQRSTGKSRWKFHKLVELAITGIASFSNVPLRVWSFIGFSISLISFVYAVWIIVDTLLFGVDLPGYATIVVAIMFFGGVQLLSIGILGEYIARIFNEVKQRPTYIIESKIGFDE